MFFAGLALTFAGCGSSTPHATQLSRATDAPAVWFEAEVEIGIRDDDVTTDTPLDSFTNGQQVFVMVAGMRASLDGENFSVSAQPLAAHGRTVGMARCVNDRWLLVHEGDDTVVVVADGFLGASVATHRLPGRLLPSGGQLGRMAGRSDGRNPVFAGRTEDAYALVTDGGAFLVPCDGGSPRELQPTQSAWVEALYLEGQRGLAVVDDGRLAQSEDAGRTWRPLARSLPVAQLRVEGSHVSAMFPDLTREVVSWSSEEGPIVPPPLARASNAQSERMRGQIARALLQHAISSSTQLVPSGDDALRLYPSGHVVFVSGGNLLRVPPVGPVEVLYRSAREGGCEFVDGASAIRCPHALLTLAQDGSLASTLRLPAGAAVAVDVRNGSVVLGASCRSGDVARLGLCRLDVATGTRQPIGWPSVAEPHPLLIAGEHVLVSSGSAPRSRIAGRARSGPLVWVSPDDHVTPVHWPYSVAVSRVHSTEDGSFSYVVVDRSATDRTLVQLMGPGMDRHVALPPGTSALGFASATLGVALARDGAFVSRDGGASWQPLLAPLVHARSSFPRMEALSCSASSCRIADNVYVGDTLPTPPPAHDPPFAHGRLPYLVQYFDCSEVGTMQTPPVPQNEGVALSGPHVVWLEQRGAQARYGWRGPSGSTNWSSWHEGTPPVALSPLSIEDDMALVLECPSGPRSCSLLRLVPDAATDVLNSRLDAHVSRFSVARSGRGETFLRAVDMRVSMAQLYITHIYRVTPTADPEEVRVSFGSIPSLVEHHDRVEVLLTDGRPGPGLLLPARRDDPSAPRRVPWRAGAPPLPCPSDAARVVLGSVWAPDLSVTLAGPVPRGGGAWDGAWTLELGISEGRACVLGVAEQQLPAGHSMGPFRWDGDGMLAGASHRTNSRVDYRCTPTR